MEKIASLGLPQWNFGSLAKASLII